MDLITINVNDNVISCFESERLLDVCMNNGIYIPHLCSHPQLATTGACGLCIVEVAGNLARACTLKVTEGMVVKTDSTEISELRRLMMELILSEHPEDCSSCPAFGNCTLQSVIQYIGASNGRFRSIEKHSSINKNNPLFIHDMYRCIKCGRCVRACRDLRGVGALKYYRDEQGDWVVGSQSQLLSAVDCRFCGACVEVCPTGALRDKEEALSPVTHTREQTLVPCSAGCPAHINIPEYLRHIREGNLQLAVNTIREKVAFPASLGYVCRQFCEASCKRRMLNDAVSIRELKKTAALADDGSWKEHLVKSAPTGKRIAVIGAGPAGLTAALDLTLRGNDVTVYEKQDKGGGMLRYGIPEYRLPSKIIEKEVNEIASLGVHIVTGHEIQDARALSGEFDAVIAAHGAWLSSISDVPGSELQGVVGSIDFLSSIRKNQSAKIEGTVAIIGAGNVAFDCARTALRAGAKSVKLIARKSPEHFRCDPMEYKEAIEEGLEVISPVVVLSINGNTHVSSITVCTLRRVDSDGHIAFERDESEVPQEIITETVVFAIGQQSEPLGLSLSRHGHIEADSKLRTSEQGIFTAGDALSGTKSVIEAIASGHDVADRVSEFLGDECVKTVRTYTEEHNGNIGKIEGFFNLHRIEPTIIPPDERIRNFHPVFSPLSQEQARAEASRCLQCDLRTEICHDRLWTEFKKDYIEEIKAKTSPSSCGFELHIPEGRKWDNIVTHPAEGVCPISHLGDILTAAYTASCGECEVCRLGCKQLVALTKAITEGEAKIEELENYLYVANGMERLSCCDYGTHLGTAIKEYYLTYQDQFEQHIRRKKCVNLSCKGYITYHILPNICTGCSVCKTVCPAKAILGESGEIHVIDKFDCIKCGRCKEVCIEKAVTRAGPIKPKTPKEPIPVGTWKR